MPGDTNGQRDAFVFDQVAQTTIRVSVDSNGVEGNGNTSQVLISANGRFATFISDADNLVPGDTNGVTDVFVHEIATGITTRISVDSNGQESNGPIRGSGLGLNHGGISADGRFVTFSSDATNLVPGDTNTFTDVFLHDRQTGATTMVSVDSNGQPGNNASTDATLTPDGRFVVYTSRATNLASGGTSLIDIFRYDRQTGETRRVSIDANFDPANGNSFSPTVSADGRLVAFYSTATDLLPGGTATATHVFTRDMGTQLVEVSLTVSPTNDAPTLVTPLSDVTVDEDANNQTIDLSAFFADVDSSLSYSVSRSNPSLVDASISGSNLTLDFLPNQFGVATMTVTADDGEFQISDAFEVTVNPIDDPPVVISPLDDIVIDEDDPAYVDNGPVVIDLNTIFDDPDDALTFSATGQQTSGVPGFFGVWVVGDELFLSAAPDRNGTGDYTVTATDGTTSVMESFSVTVNPVNDPIFTAQCVTAGKCDRQ